MLTGVGDKKQGIYKVHYSKRFSLKAAMVKDIVPETRLNKEAQ